MKNILLLSFVSAILLTSCDYVDDPKPDIVVSDTTGGYFPPFPKVTSHVKKILIEDYTGHTCSNCPDAAATLHTVSTNFPDRIVGLGLHVSSTFAAPITGSFPGAPDGAFKADYRTAVGTTYDVFFGASAAGLPQGMINRKDYTSTSTNHLKFFDDWNSYVNGIINEPSVVDLQIAASYDNLSRKIFFAVKDSFLTTSTISDTLRLVVLLTQDSIIDYQKGFSGPIANYVHQHVLRDAITPAGAWGELLVSGTITPGTTHKNYFGFTIPESYKNIVCEPKDCHLVAFIYKTDK